ncbi:palmitoyltransferase akr1 [Naganishia albida]|nr:palmitoyltransferase akr1 [Naganishia albida]
MADRIPESLRPAEKSPVDAQVAKVNGQGEGVGSSRQTMTIVEQDTEPSIHQLCQSGNLVALEHIARSGKLDVNARDDSNVTPLHWAAINAHVDVCRWLLGRGAEVDAIGGDLQATPLQWAARNGHLYVIHLLLKHGADPTLRDAQGFNTLHLVTHSSGVMALLYVLLQPTVSVDEKDTDGHTALMWAAWQGDAISIDILLRHGASTAATDNTHLTPLHWASIKASRPCIQRLVAAGADLSAKDENGKTARDMADEIKVLEPYRLGLEDAGYALDGFKIQPFLDERRTQYAILLAPTVFLGAVFSAFAYLPIYVGVPLGLAIFFAMHHIITRTLLRTKGFGDTVSKSPYFAAVIIASLIWVGSTWLRVLLTGTSSLSLNICFVLAYTACAYNFYRAITLDPGYSKLPKDEEELHSLVEDLAATGRLNGTVFCISCMALKPLRAKHCRMCNRCIARFDHHCPWIWNCVGSGNHRQFLLFVATLVAGISSFDTLTVSYYTQNAPTYEAAPSAYLEFCNIAPSLCGAYHFAPFLLVVAAWSTLQLTWTIILLATQIFQVCRQMTTLEVSNLGRYGFMGGRGGSSLREQTGAMAQLMARQGQQPSVLGAGPGQSGAEEEGEILSSTQSGDSVGVGAIPVGGTNGAHVHGPGCKHGHGHSAHHHRFGIVGRICSTALHACTGGPMLQLLGLDRFTKGKAMSGMRKSGQGGAGSNPFSLGIVGNCHDFWTNGGALGVDYTALYEIPENGFSYRRQGTMPTMRGQRGDPAAGGYEPVGQENV